MIDFLIETAFFYHFIALRIRTAIYRYTKILLLCPTMVRESTKKFPFLMKTQSIANLVVELVGSKKLSRVLIINNNFINYRASARSNLFQRYVS
jgi:hypothetical protein